MDTRWRQRLAAGLGIPGWWPRWVGCSLLPVWSCAAHRGVYWGEGRAEHGGGPDGTKTRLLW